MNKIFDKFISPNNSKLLEKKDEKLFDGELEFEINDNIPNLIYPKSLNDETNDVFPGMIVDPTNTLFSPVCNNGNNYIQNVDLIINKNTLTDKQIALFLSNNTTLDSGVFPYSVNFNNTTC